MRNGVPSAGGTNVASPDTIKAMPPEMTFDYFAVRLNAEKAAGKKLALNIEFFDLRDGSLVNSRIPASAAGAGTAIAISAAAAAIATRLLHMARPPHERHRGNPNACLRIWLRCRFVRKNIAAPSYWTHIHEHALNSSSVVKRIRLLWRTEF
jgi:alkyl sulfatase BDS1-like metallo-beta-lactamase superfamily hydrolase